VKLPHKPTTKLCLTWNDPASIRYMPFRAQFAGFRTGRTLQLLPLQRSSQHLLPNPLTSCNCNFAMVCSSVSFTTASNVSAIAASMMATRQTALLPKMKIPGVNLESNTYPTLAVSSIWLDCASSSASAQTNFLLTVTNPAYICALTSTAFSRVVCRAQELRDCQSCYRFNDFHCVRCR